MKNKSSCASGKRVFDSKELAEEALIQNHIMNNHRLNEGPVNIYECSECMNWHFTSKGMKHELLNDPEIIKRIETERRAVYWERHLK